MKIMSGQIGPKELFQGEQAHLFSYTNFTLRTFTALLEKPFTASFVLGSVGLGAVPVFVSGINKLCCTLLSHTNSMAFVFLKTNFSVQYVTNIQLKSLKSFLPEVGSKPLFLA